MTGQLVFGLAPGAAPDRDPVFVLHPAESDETARLTACLQAHRELSAFLPFAPRQTVTPAAAESLMSRAGDDLRRQLRRLAGRDEAILRLNLAEAQVEGPPTGLGWLRQRALARAPETAALAWLDRVAPWAEGRRLTAGRRAWHLSLLIRRADLDRLGQAVTEAGPLPDGARLVITSPWPAFSFSRIGAMQ